MGQDERYRKLYEELLLNGWEPSIDEYTPGLSKEEWKKFILDVEMPSKSNSIKMLKAMMQLGGEASCKKLSELYKKRVSAFIGYTTGIAKRVKKYFDLAHQGKMVLYTIPFIGKYVKENGKESYYYRIRPELYEALNELDMSQISLDNEEVSGVSKRTTHDNDIGLNTIFYGPPGTGKTYHTVIYAVAIIENKSVMEVKREDYESVFERYNKYKDTGMIEFTTFHQSYGYEEFIEGIRPVMDNTDEETPGIQYQLSPGVFKIFCDRAIRPSIEQFGSNIGLNGAPNIWKISLQGTGDNPTRQECMENNHVRIGYDSYGKEITSETKFLDGGKNVVNAFVAKMKIGDIVLSCYSASAIDAIGVIAGDYEWHDEYDCYKRLRKVIWLVKDIREDIVSINGGRTLTLSAVYKLNIALTDVMEIVHKKAAKISSLQCERKNYVFVIDEINRGNISKIFGELITLIEPAKRVGNAEEIRARLPYSQQLFGVPNNIYIIGTMNTADRSIAAIDTALRRRFSFKEMLPDTDVLHGIDVEGVSVERMLLNINRRIELLYDREHTIGHAYFILLRKTPTLEKLSDIFENAVFPLLQEYFLEDYEKIRYVLADNQKNDENEQFIKVFDNECEELFGKEMPEIVEDVRYEVNHKAFHNIEAYKRI